MKKLNGLFIALAATAYVAATGVFIAHGNPNFCVVGIVCLIMCAVPHPPLGHFLCSLAFLAEALGWIGVGEASVAVALCITYSTRLLEDSRKPHPVPKWESNGYDDRVNAGMVSVGDGDD